MYRSAVNVNRNLFVETCTVFPPRHLIEFIGNKQGKTPKTNMNHLARFNLSKTRGIYKDTNTVKSYTFLRDSDTQLSLMKVLLMNQVHSLMNESSFLINDDNNLLHEMLPILTTHQQPFPEFIIAVLFE